MTFGIAALLILMTINIITRLLTNDKGKRDEIGRDKNLKKLEI
jgi:hypothetical protein